MLICFICEELKYMNINVFALACLHERQHFCRNELICLKISDNICNNLVYYIMSEKKDIIIFINCLRNHQPLTNIFIRNFLVLIKSEKFCSYVSKQIN